MNDIKTVDDAVRFIAKNVHSTRRSEHTTREDVQSIMNKLLSRLGVDITKIPSVHIAGTKGKGSTCTFTESILRNHNLKTGLFTSPHLISATERIKINGKPISDEIFIDNFKEVWNKLFLPTKYDDPLNIIGFFHFMTLLAFYIFSKENVDVMIIEVGIGGRLDATNVINPIVCGITLIDYDHMNLLGNTLELIANEKAGIMKKNIPCYCLPQQSESIEKVFIETGEKVNCSVTIIDVELFKKEYNELNLQIYGEHQYNNSFLSINLSKHIIVDYYKKEFNKDLIINSLNNTLFPGRSQCYKPINSKITYYLDGAHTPASISATVKWFHSLILENSKNNNILIFNINYEKKIKDILLEIPFNLFKCILLVPFLFPKPLLVHEELPLFNSFYPSEIEPNIVIKKYPNEFEFTEQHEWLITLNKMIYYISKMKDEKTIPEILVFKNPLESINYLNDNYNFDNTKVYVTGSLYLVGDILSTLGYNYSN